MILPILLYGHPILRDRAKEIDKDHPNLSQLIADMFETMEGSDGVGLAAPQIGQSIRLFVVDASGFSEELEGYRKIFINPEVIGEGEEDSDFDEGCLSIPNIREKVTRPESIQVRYQNENFETIEETLSGMPARIFQHELDHLDGALFIDYISAFKRTLLRNRLADITVGKVDTKYPVLRAPVKRGK